LFLKEKEESQSMTRPKLTVVQPEKEGYEEHQVIVRPERNIDRLPAIWAPSNGVSPARVKVKTIDFDVDLNGKSVSAQLVILPGTMYVEPSKREKKRKGQPAGKKKEVRVILTTFDQRVFLVLVKIWEENEKKDAHIYFSMRGIAQELGLEWGSETKRLIEESLYRLKLVTLDWQKSFVVKNGKDVEITSLEPTNILTELKIVKRKENGEIVKEKGYFRFHSSIENNLKNTYTRPVRLDVVCSFTSHVAQLIYTLIDREMYGDTAKPFQMRSENLFRVLGLVGERYRYKSRRAQALEPALKELIGKPLSSGEIITSAELKETADKKDFNAIFRKGISKRALCAGNDPLVARRIERLVAAGFGNRAAADLASEYPDECDRQLDALPWRDMSDKPNPVGWLRCAIREGYSTPAVPEEGSPAAIAAEQAEAAAKQANVEKAKVCPFCKDSELLGQRRVITDKHPGGAWKKCTHDPEEESKFISA
jgi:hypothetical protein